MPVAPSTTSAPSLSPPTAAVPSPTALGTTTTSLPPSTPAFAGRVSAVTAADVASSYHAGCPVGPVQLRVLRMSYWGFDDRPHTGTMIVNAKVVEPVLSVFGTLYARRFPIRRMEPVDVFGGSDPASMAADNT